MEIVEKEMTTICKCSTRNWNKLKAVGIKGSKAIVYGCYSTIVVHYSTYLEHW
jgi:hypothetical protein